MMRISTIVFCMILAATAAGRYRAEANVRANKAEIDRIEAEIQEEEKRISKLELEVQVLESTSRISQLSSKKLELKAVRPEQMATAEEFAALVEVPVSSSEKEKQPHSEDFILDALAMAELMPSR